MTHQIPPEWLDQAGLRHFTPKTEWYSTHDEKTCDMVIVPIGEIAPLIRATGTPAFDHDRMLSVLRAIRDDVVLPPIAVYALPKEGYRFRIAHGVHRYYASATLGFSKIPAEVWPHEF